MTYDSWKTRSDLDDAPGPEWPEDDTECECVAVFEAQERLIETLTAALEPFASMADPYKAPEEILAGLKPAYSLTFAHLNAARAALSQAKRIEQS